MGEKTKAKKGAKVVTRFAPSPTGFLHLGTYRTAIFAYLYAKKHKGDFVLRIEDTDHERSKKEYEDNIIQSLQWLGLTYDKFYRQSDNKAQHKFYLEKLIKEGSAYVSKEEAKDGSGVIKELVRFKNPNIDVTFKDEIKGEITMNTKDLGDFVIAKNLDEPLYNFAVVVDDFEEGITHIIRGEDHTSNTPRQILVGRAIGAMTPIYAHVPLVLGADKLKLSKRRGALSVLEYKKLGFLPEAILNATAFVGWNPGTEKEIFTHDQLVEAFDLSKVQKSPAMLSEEKLNWFNKEHMKKLSPEIIEKEILERLPKNIPNPKFLAPVIFERISKWSDVDDMVARGELDFFFNIPTIDKNKLISKNSNPTSVETNLFKVEKALEKISDVNFTPQEIKSSIMGVISNLPNTSTGEVLHPVRFALSGRDASPDPFTIASVLGKSQAISRIKNAQDIL